jgi:hypothetical protein
MVERKIEDVLGEYRFGYKRGEEGAGGGGNKDAIGILRIISEGNMYIEEELCAGFIDWQEAFDCANWAKLMQIPKGTGIDWRERRLISKLYRDQSVKVRLDGGDTRSGKIGRGIRQGRCLSPVLFNLYSRTLLTRLLNGLETSK